MRSVLFTAYLPQKFLSRYKNCSSYLQSSSSHSIKRWHICNSSPHTVLKSDIPKEVGSGKLALYDHLWIFGCDAFVHIRQDSRNKLDVNAHYKNFNGIRWWRPNGLQLLLSPFKNRHNVFNQEKQLKASIYSKDYNRSFKFQYVQPPLSAKTSLRIYYKGMKITLRL